jgi:hypothetical protein
VETPAAEPAPGVCVEVAGAPVEVDEILVVRRGPGANCSSIGSALDALFFSVAVAGAVLVAVAAALGDDQRAGSTADDEREARDESEG